MKWNILFGILIIKCILKHLYDKTCLGDAYNIFNNIGDDKELFDQVEYTLSYSEKYKYLQPSEITYARVNLKSFMVSDTYFHTIN